MACWVLRACNFREQANISWRTLASNTGPSVSIQWVWRTLLARPECQPSLKGSGASVSPTGTLYFELEGHGSSNNLLVRGRARIQTHLGVFDSKSCLLCTAAHCLSGRARHGAFGETEKWAHRSCIPVGAHLQLPGHATCWVTNPSRASGTGFSLSGGNKTLPWSCCHNLPSDHGKNCLLVLWV